MPTRSSSSTARVQRLVLATSPGATRIISAIWWPMRVHRVQRRQRILEDHRDLACRGPRAVFFGWRRSARSPPTLAEPAIMAVLRQQPHQAEERDRLAGTGLADDADELARVDVEVDAAHGLHDRRPRWGTRPVKSRSLEDDWRGSSGSASLHGRLGSTDGLLRVERVTQPSPMKLIAQHGQDEAPDTGTPPATTCR